MVTWQTWMASTDGDVVDIGGSEVVVVGDSDVVLLVGVTVGNEHALA